MKKSNSKCLEDKWCGKHEPLPRVFYIKWLTLMLRCDNKPNCGQQYHEDDQPRHRNETCILFWVMEPSWFQQHTAAATQSWYLSMGVELLKGKVIWRVSEHPVEEAMMEMWGQLGYSTYHPNDHQGGVRWSIWPERCPLPPSVLQTHFTKNCMLCSRRWPSWEKEKCSWVKSYRAAVLCQNLRTSSDKAMIKILEVNKKRT